ncbi:MAG: SURF1 family protein [Halieaceae bacterium]|jgi:cytochrome oxidase assembly protein ShyY1|nr:SURF1 family protein [Halieaceae bacterium]
MPGTATHSPRLRWDIEWRTAAFALLLVPLFCALGVWQLGRAEEKRAIAEGWEQHRLQPAVALDALPDNPDTLRYRPVVLKGEFLTGRDFLLDNRIRQGRYGVEVITPLRGPSGELVLVNRGWLAGDPYRQALPEVVEAPGELELVGYVYVPPGESFTLGDIAADTGWPRLVQAIDPVAMAEMLGEPVWPYTVRLNADSPAALLADWPLVNARPEKHEAYAAQWFAMAAVLALFALWRNTNLSDLWRARKE